MATGSDMKLGMPMLEGQLSVMVVRGKGRREPRSSVDINVGLRRRGASVVTAQVIDLSTSGFRASSHLVLTPGTEVWLRLPGLEALPARVAWTETHYIGCEFIQPLHPAVLDMIVRRPC